ncbi:Gfo/Idh/MocA family protein [Parasphingorhabdus sp.]|uniref:Gfo/Idh/MocA family protein n=1 Tax=Parasphingorhabdus sp. TaxID=2709688 RepID=UPI003A910F64
MRSTIGVGIIGANPDRGWAHDAHIPAIQASPQFELRAVSTSHTETAERAGRIYGVPSFDTPEALVKHPAVELVVIAVKVPKHKMLVKAALAERKAILCEWPLGNGLEEAVELAEKAEALGVKGFVGLQARSAPGFRHVSSLLRQGYVGEVLSTSIVASGGSWGSVIERQSAYILDESNGASLLTIPFGHTMEGVCYCLGEADYLSAEMATRRNTVTEIETGQQLAMTVADQIAVSGRLQSGATLSAHFRGGLSSGLNFHWEINGTEGDIVVSGENGLSQMCELVVAGAKTGNGLTRIPTPPNCLWAPSGSGSPAGAPFNVAQAYALIAKDLSDGGHRSPTFNDAVKRHRMLEAVEKAARTGLRQSYLEDQGRGNCRHV